MKNSGVVNVVISGKRRRIKTSVFRRLVRNASVTTGGRKIFDPCCDHIIYGLILSGKVFYIGCTSDLKKRKLQLKHDAKFENVNFNNVTFHEFAIEKNKREGQLTEATLFLFYKLFGQCEKNIGMTINFKQFPPSFKRLFYL